MLVRFRQGAQVLLYLLSTTNQYLMHFLASVFTGVGFAVSSFFPHFRGGPIGPASSTPPSDGDRHVATTTWEGDGGHGLASSTWNGHHNGDMASSTVSAATIACVGSAVATREASLDSAESALSSAYTTRASALAAAYALTTGSAVKAAVKLAWSNFSSAEKTWKSAQGTAWQTFKTASQSCKAPPDLLDTNLDTSDGPIGNPENNNGPRS